MVTRLSIAFCQHLSYKRKSDVVISQFKYTSEV